MTPILFDAAGLLKCCEFMWIEVNICLFSGPRHATLHVIFRIPRGDQKNLRGSRARFHPNHMHLRAWLRAQVMRTRCDMYHPSRIRLTSLHRVVSFGCC